MEDPAKLSKEALDSDSSNPSHHFNLGLFFWRRGEQAEGDDESREWKDRAVEHFVASAKLNPGDGASFRFLGHYYARVSIDVHRAAKCYQRAVSLNPEDFEAGEGLCDLLDGSGKESLEVAICKEAAGKSPRAFWAFQRMGYLQVHQKKWSEAVQSLQHAIRGYPACAELWEALGLAYHRLGMFSAAIKSYGRAIELDDLRIFALIDSGNIHLMLGAYKNGVEQFHRALDIAPHNLSAHLGLASGLLGLSKDSIKLGAFGWGAALLEEASNAVKASTQLAGNLFSSWKLHGDIQIAYAKCFPWEDERINSEMNEEIFNASINHWKKKCLLAAKSAKKSYQRALHLAPSQANLYTDISISLDLICFFREVTTDIDVWKLPVRMSLGGLMLEGMNSDFWVTLGCLSDDCALKQHALIRGLQLNGSLSAAWAFLGKLYQKLGEKLLARQAFDHARSIDPSLALPWAGMSLDFYDRKYSVVEAYESCQRAVQILPLPEFQVGLGILATISGHLLSPQVFGAIWQAVQRAPFHPESHNLKGLVHEARKDYESAIIAYRHARYAMNIVRNTDPAFKTCITDVSINLARSLCLVGCANDAVQECEDLMIKGALNVEGLQIYAVALWQLGRNEECLSVVHDLISNVLNMDKTCATAVLVLVCKLIYAIKGPQSAAAIMLQLPKELLQNRKMGFIISTLNALDSTSHPKMFLSNILQTIMSDAVAAAEIHSIIAIRQMMSSGSNQILDVEKGLKYLRKVLHLYPSSGLIRGQLGSLLLSDENWVFSRRAIKCSLMPTGDHVSHGLKSPFEIHGAVGVACYAISAACPKFSFPTCKEQLIQGAPVTHYLQKWLHQEPWNDKAHLLLILNVYQKAREEKFPQYLCITLKRLILAALSRKSSVKESGQHQYQSFLLLLCASEISLQCGDYLGCTSHATSALELVPSRSDLFFAHLQLCRAYAAQADLASLKNEYMNCLQLKTAHQIGWIALKYLESRYKLLDYSSSIDVNYQSCLKDRWTSSHFWRAVFNLVCAQCSMDDQDFFRAEETLMQAVSQKNADSCLLLCHGAVCMELARRQPGSPFLVRAAASLKKAQEISPASLPIVSALYAQAQASLGMRAEWERNLQLEWFSWPAEMRPAELYFQMHLLARQSNKIPNQSNRMPNQQANVEFSRSAERWILQAIHLNPSCLRYWKVLQKLKES